MLAIAPTPQRSQSPDKATSAFARVNGQLCGKTRPSRRNLGAEVLATLERAIRSRRACAGELVD